MTIFDTNMSAVAADDFDITTLPSFITDAAKRTRKVYPKVAMTGDPVIEALPDGLLVSLFGTLGVDRFMRIDVADWLFISSHFTARCVVNSDGKGREYVKSAVQSVRRAARQAGDCPSVSLARLILDAMPGDRVRYLSGDRFDLRRSNLALERPRPGVRAVKSVTSLGTVPMDAR